MLKDLNMKKKELLEQIRNDKVEFNYFYFDLSIIFISEQ